MARTMPAAITAILFSAAAAADVIDPNNPYASRVYPSPVPPAIFGMSPEVFVLAVLGASVLIVVTGSALLLWLILKRKPAAAAKNKPAKKK